MVTILLDKLLEQKGKTLYWLAKETGINHTLLFRYQKNTAQRITLTHISAICEALDCSPNDLIGFERTKAKPTRKASKKVSKKKSR